MQNLTYSFLIIAGRSWLLKHFMYFLRDWVGVGVEGWGGGRECRAERGQCGPGEAGQLQLVQNKSCNFNLDKLDTFIDHVFPGIPLFVNICQTTVSSSSYHHQAHLSIFSFLNVVHLIILSLYSSSFSLPHAAEPISLHLKKNEKNNFFTSV